MKFSMYALFSAILISGVLSQGILQQQQQAPQFRPLQQYNTRRQLTPGQQTLILNDVQQHQHRFSFPQNQISSVDSTRQIKSHPQKSSSFQLEPAISKQLPTQTTIINHQRIPAQYQFTHQQPIQQQSQNNFRSIVPPQQNHDLHNVQHHTQTNFIPNFAQQQQQQQQQPIAEQPPRSASQNQYNSLFTGPQPTQQLSQQFHQQPLNQRSIQSQFGQQQLLQQQPQQQQQQKPFQPSIQFPEPLLPTPLSPAEPTTFLAPSSLPNFIPVQQTNQQIYNQAQPVFQRHQQQTANQPQQTTAQLLQIQQSQQLNNQFIQQLPQEQAPVNFAASFNPQQQQQQQQQQQYLQSLQQFPPLPLQQQPQQQQQQQYRQQQQAYISKEEQDRIQEKQKIIQKHEQFVQKQYQKQQNRVKQQHEEFLAKQRRIKDQSIAAQQQANREKQQQQQQQQRSRVVQPYDSDAFQRALKQYQIVNPTTASPITTPSQSLSTLSAKLRSQNNKQKNHHQQQQEFSDEQLEKYLQTHRETLFDELNKDTEFQKQIKTKNQKVKSTKALGREDLLKQLKLALADSPQPELGNKTYDSMDIVLPNGQKVQVIRTTDPKLIENGGSPNSDQYLSPERLVLSSSTTPRPEVFYEELSKSGLLPNGADFEVIKQSANGELQTVGGNIPVAPKKKVTFVYLEEQTDGSFKVQGVKSNNDKEAQTSGAEVDSIIKRIKEGDIKLPPSSNKAGSLSIIATTPASSVSSASPTTSVSVIPLGGEDSTSGSVRSTRFESSTTPNVYTKSNGDPSPSPSISYGSSSLSPYSTLATITGSDSTINLSTASSTNYPSSTQSSLSTFQSTYDSSPSRASASSTSFDGSSSGSVGSSIFDHPITQSYDGTQTATSSPFVSSTRAPSSHFPSSASSPFPSSVNTNFPSSPSSQYPSSISQQIESSTAAYLDDLSRKSTFQSGGISSTTPQIFLSSTGAPSTVVPEEPSQLSIILKSRGLHAMAKYLKQSGLDSILNETGPYTVFAPTDKAFKSLLVQLGGPERAEEKFKTNPRLLSGLLLHHVIPGSFEISSLQDEMTGVSLAGTQLRVNQYSLHDQEWNDITVTTINGAMVVPDKKDITIPQGIAHAVDRVMFPLPVGDILQTLASDRERRFTKFLKALSSSGMTDLLQNKEFGAKTYTVFAPIDAAFSNSTEEELEQILNNKEESTKFVMKHISSGTLFSAGMRFYQVKDSLNGNSPFTIQKTSAGKIMINDAQILTSNVPATNGVIHAIDELL